MTILYVDGGCSNNGQPDLTQRRMRMVVTDVGGHVLSDIRDVPGGSNNIAELGAVKDALQWCADHQVYDVEIRTDSTNNLAWVYGRTVGLAINDRATVVRLKEAIGILRGRIRVRLVVVPRAVNLAGHVIEGIVSR